MADKQTPNSDFGSENRRSNEELRQAFREAVLRIDAQKNKAKAPSQTAWLPNLIIEMNP